MRKIAVILISIILLASFLALVYYALTHSKGVPTAVEKPKRIILEVLFLDRDIDLSEGISLDVWDDTLGKEVGLLYQVMVLPWPKVVTPFVTVKAFHNAKDIYFYISWKDQTHDRDLKTNKFSDACAIMFPLGKEVQPSTIMMGFIGKANIWQWKASQDREFWLREGPKTEAYADFHYPFEEEETLIVSKDIPKSAANDLIAIRVGTITSKETQNVSGRGFWKDGLWQVVFKRSLKPIDLQLDADFSPGKNLCAFAVWNGSMGDRGGRKSISDWVELVIK